MVKLWWPFPGAGSGLIVIAGEGGGQLAVTEADSNKGHCLLPVDPVSCRCGLNKSQ